MTCIQRHFYYNDHKGGKMARYEVVHRYDGESPIFYIEASDQELLDKICHMLGEVCTRQYANRLQVKPGCQEDHFVLKWKLYDYLLEHEWEPMGRGFFRIA
jgi:hypothetical protein